jgi:hypothetical protein
MKFNLLKLRNKFTKLLLAKKMYLTHKTSYNNWNIIRWNNVENLIYQKQQDIYQARFRDDTNRLHYLQTKFINSTRRKLITIRRIINNFKTRPNKIYYEKKQTFFKKILGIFKKKITEKQYRKNEKKSLYIHISSFNNDCKVFIINLTIEPEWERKFCKYDPRNLNFRIGYDPQDTIEQLRKKLQNPVCLIRIELRTIKIVFYPRIFEKIHIKQENYNLVRVMLKKIENNKIRFIKNKMNRYKKKNPFFFLHQSRSLWGGTNNCRKNQYENQKH